MNFGTRDDCHGPGSLPGGQTSILSAGCKLKAIPTPMTRTQSWILGLMFVSVVINYIDRGSLSTAAPLLQADMTIPPAQLGWLLSSFFWTYALLQIASGWLADRYEVKWGMALGFCL